MGKEGHLIAQPDPRDRYDERIRFDAALKELRKLPPALQRVVLIRSQVWKHEEVAEVMGIKPEQVDRLLRAAAIQLAAVNENRHERERPVASPRAARLREIEDDPPAWLTSASASARPARSPLLPSCSRGAGRHSRSRTTGPSAATTHRPKRSGSSRPGRLRGARTCAPSARSSTWPTSASGATAESGASPIAPPADDAGPVISRRATRRLGVIDKVPRRRANAPGPAQEVGSICRQTVAPVRRGTRAAFAGSGVCDVLRVELDALQRAGLDGRLAARIEALEARGATLELDGGSGAGCAELEGVAHELRVLARMRAALPACPHAPFTLVGPAGLVSALIRACLAEAVACLERRLAGRPGDRGVLAGLEPELRLAGAWIVTALDCAAVESFCFEPDVDPLWAA